MKNIKFKLLLTISFVMVLISCSNKDVPKEEIASPTIIKGPPVETKAPNTDYKPAFIGQTRISSVKTTTPFKFNIITSSLNSPWGIASLPDGRFLISEQSGVMRIITKEGKIGSSISGIPSVNSSGQGGLLGLCIDTKFESSRLVFWAFSENVTGGTITSVAKGKLSIDELSFESVSVIYRSNKVFNGNLHYGARIVIDSKDQLLICLGERSSLETRPLAQSVSSSLGKVIRIDKDGQASSDNPIFNGTGALSELFSIGHRNPQGLAIHPSSGQIWLSEFGPKGGDEINLLQAGKNYGWPTISYGIEYSGTKVGNGIQQLEGMEQPIYYWDPSISPSGMTFYKGNRIPEWQNNLFIGALSGKHIIRLYFENNSVTGEERLLESENQRFRDIAQGVDGALYAITDEGRLYKIDKE